MPDTETIVVIDPSTVERASFHFVIQRSNVEQVKIAVPELNKFTESSFLVCGYIQPACFLSLPGPAAPSMAQNPPRALPNEHYAFRRHSLPLRRCKDITPSGTLSSRLDAVRLNPLVHVGAGAAAGRCGLACLAIRHILPSIR